MTESHYCVFCNRGKKKGEWKTTSLKNTYVDVIPTSRGPKRILHGTCMVCKHKVTKMISVKTNG